MLNRIRLNEDIIPITEFRNNVSEIIEKTRNTKRPVLITQNGKGSVVVIDVKEYDQLMETVEITTAIKRAEENIKSGRTIGNKKAINKVMKSIKGERLG
jgi:prevent-host-death family protein